MSGNHPNFDRKMDRPFSEHLWQFQEILGAISELHSQPKLQYLKNQLSVSEQFSEGEKWPKMGQGKTVDQFKVHSPNLSRLSMLSMSCYKRLANTWVFRSRSAKVNLSNIEKVHSSIISIDQCNG